MRSSIAAFAGAVLLSTTVFASEVTSTLKIGGWRNTNCAARTQAALLKVKGVRSAVSNYSAKTVAVIYENTEASSADLTQAIAGLNYTIEP